MDLINDFQHNVRVMGRVGAPPMKLYAALLVRLVEKPGHRRMLEELRRQAELMGFRVRSINDLGFPLVDRKNYAFLMDAQASMLKGFSSSVEDVIRNVYGALCPEDDPRLVNEILESVEDLLGRPMAQILFGRVKPDLAYALIAIATVPKETVTLMTDSVEFISSAMGLPKGEVPSLMDVAEAIVKLFGEKSEG